MPQQNGTGERAPQRDEPRATPQQTQPASSPTEAPPVANEAESSSPPQPKQRREPPGRTPDKPPPLATPETEPIPPPKATPDSEAKPVPPGEEEEPERTASESLYGEDLPPDFWDSDPVADIDVQTVAQNEPKPDEVGFVGSSRSPEPPQSRQQPKQEVTGKLTDDPRFEVMQSLFPGQIVEWQDAEEVATEEGADESDADDPDEEVDGLN